LSRIKFLEASHASVCADTADPMRGERPSSLPRDRSDFADVYAAEFIDQFFDGFRRPGGVLPTLNGDRSTDLPAVKLDGGIPCGHAGNEWTPA